VIYETFVGTFERYEWDHIITLGLAALYSSDIMCHSGNIVWRICLKLMCWGNFHLTQTSPVYDCIFWG